MPDFYDLVLWLLELKMFITTSCSMALAGFAFWSQIALLEHKKYTT